MISKVFFVIFFSLSTQIAIAGGISGGGGNSLPQNPIGTHGIESILTLNHPKFVAFAFFNSSTAVLDLNEITKDSSYLSSNLIFEKIKNVNIYIAADGPCYDADRKEMDGSIVSPVPNTICISSQRLGEKLTNDNGFVQTMALVIHEYSHLIGANEEQADNIQYKALRELNLETFYRNITEHYFKEFSRRSLEFSKILNDTLSMSESPYSLKAYFLNTTSGFAASGQPSLFLTVCNEYLTPYHEERLKALFNKWEIIRSGFDTYERQKNKSYDKAFGNSEIITISDFIKNSTSQPYLYKTEENSKLLVKKINTSEDYVPAIEELHQEFHNLLSDIRDLQRYFIFNNQQDM